MDRDAVIKVALAEIGYREKKSNASLEETGANAGEGNYTKYGSFFDTVATDFYNGKKNGFPWCAVFVHWCFCHAYGVDEARRKTYQPVRGFGASCTCAYNYYKEANAVSNVPSIGAQVFFGTPDEFTHTGLVVNVTDDTITTVEGNTANNMVERKTYSRSDGYIKGYGLPRYIEAEEDDLVTESEYVINVPKGVTTIVINLCGD